MYEAALYTANNNLIKSTTSSDDVLMMMEIATKIDRE